MATAPASPLPQLSALDRAILLATRAEGFGDDVARAMASPTKRDGEDLVWAEQQAMPQ